MPRPTGNHQSHASNAERSGASDAGLRKGVGAAAFLAAGAFLFGAVVLAAEPCRNKNRADSIAAESGRHDSPPAQLPLMPGADGSFS
jgi:hypothetical protein